MNEAEQSGFTLLEMVCIIALIAILASVLLPFVPRQTSRSRLQGFALETATLLKADRNAAIRRGADVVTLVDAPSRAIVAIGSVMSTNSRGVRLLEEHLALTQTAHTVMATAIPKRNELGRGRLSGELSQYRWQIDIGPVGGEWEANDDRVSWIPELIKIRVRSPRGATVDLETVRLMMRPQR